MVDFKWKKQDGKLTYKARAYLKLTYKNQYSEGEFYENREEVSRILKKEQSVKPKILVRRIRTTIPEKRRKRIKGKPIPKERIRKQKVWNYTNNENPYYLSLRVVTINPDIKERGLKLSLYKLRNKYQGRHIYLKHKYKYIKIDFNEYSFEPEPYKEYKESKRDNSVVGTEKERIGDKEDKILDDLEIHYEFIIEKNDPEYGII